MKQKKYRLKTVLDVRERKKDEAVNFLAMCRERLANEENELQRRVTTLEDCRLNLMNANDLMIEDMIDGTLAQKIIAHKNHINDLKELERQLLESVTEQKKVVEQAEKEVEKATADLIIASKEVRVIEKHKEQWLENQKKAELKKEQKISDEIGAILHQRSENI